jgi:hypothetical protein
MFVTGQKVVCIDDKVPASVRALYTCWIKEGQVYVVRHVASGTAPMEMGLTDEIRVLLIGVVNPMNSQGDERGFRAERFKPLQEITTDEIMQQTDLIGKEHHEDAYAV